MGRKKEVIEQNPTASDVAALRIMVRVREDFQDMRKRMDNSHRSQS